MFCEFTDEYLYKPSRNDWVFWGEKWWILDSFPRAAVTKYENLGGLKPQKLIVLQCWRLEVWNRGISRAVLPTKALGEGYSLSLPAPAVFCQSLAFLSLHMPHLSHTPTFRLCVFPSSPLCVCVCVQHSPLCMDTSHTGVRPTPVTSSGASLPQ